MPQLKLRILATTDLHGHLLSWDYDKHQIAPARGLSRVATLIATARQAVENTLLFDNGDFLNGSGLGDHMVDAFPSRTAHPMIGAMNHLRYDAAAIGNHELSHGIPFFQHSVMDAKFPLICSNFVFDTLRAVQPFAMLDRKMRDENGDFQDLKIGVIGLLPVQTMIWESRHLQGLARHSDMVLTARSLAQQLRSLGADVVVALTHSGLDTGGGDLSEENAANRIASIDEIDAVIAGHAHQVFPPVGAMDHHALVMPGFFGSHLGVIDLMLQKTAAGWHCIRRQAAVWPVSHRPKPTAILTPLVAEDAATAALAMAEHLKIVAASDAIIGHSNLRLHTYFSLIADSPALAVVAAAQAEYLQNSLSGGIYENIPVLSAVAPFKAGGRGGPENYTDLMAGPMRMRHASDLYVHPNQLVGFDISGHDLWLWLERSVSIYNHITSGQKDAPLINDDFPTFNFDVIFGVSYDIDLGQPARFDARGQVASETAIRVRNLRHNGQPVLPTQRFIMASNSYRKDGNIGFAGTTADHVLYQSDIGIRAIVCEYLARSNTAAAADPQRWRFCPMPSTSVIFDSSPAAVELMADLAQHKIEIMDGQETGFQRFRLHL